MKGLIIDTSRDPAILGLIFEDKIIKMALLEGSKNLSATLFPLLQSFCKIQDLNYIAVGVGPGSYMGIRTGATIAKTLAYASNLPLIEFVSPLAFLPKGKEGTFAYVGDAKMGQLYLLTGKAEKTITDLTSPILILPQDLQPYTQGKDFIVGIGHLDPEPNLNWVASQVHQRYIQNNFSNIATLELTYLR